MFIRKKRFIENPENPHDQLIKYYTRCGLRSRSFDNYLPEISRAYFKPRGKFENLDNIGYVEVKEEFYTKL